MVAYQDIVKSSCERCHVIIDRDSEQNLAYSLADHFKFAGIFLSEVPLNRVFNEPPESGEYKYGSNAEQQGETQR